MRGDALMRRFFEAFLFEDVPASGQRPDALYLNEVAHCDLYVGLFGSDYGAADADGLSATEREFNYASQLGKLRLIFLKGDAHATRDARMAALIARAEGELVRKRFQTAPELISGLYAALVEYLEANLLLRSGAFDADYCRAAGLDDLDPERLQWLVRRARHERGFPLREGVRPQTLLQHLNLGKAERLTNAALLLFGRAPQKYLVSSEIKCAHFHGTQVAKPIASLQVYKGTVFDLVNQAVDFVLSKVDRRVGTRAQSAQVPVTYEIPKEVVTEAVVNAVAHRDYTSNGSVQVMLFADRLEIWNPGALPPALTLAQLSAPHSSIPANPLLAEPCTWPATLSVWGQARSICEPGAWTRASRRRNLPLRTGSLCGFGVAYAVCRQSSQRLSQRHWQPGCWTCWRRDRWPRPLSPAAWAKSAFRDNSTRSCASSWPPDRLNTRGRIRRAVPCNGTV